MNRPAHHLSTATRISLIVGLFIAFIVGLLWFFQFQMRAAIAMRAYASGEGLWGKAQKDAVFSLERYIDTRSEDHYQAFQRAIAVPLGDRTARIELQKPSPDLAVVRAGYRQGGNPPADIEYAIDFFLQFQHSPQWAQVVEHWTRADQLIVELEKLGESVHAEMTSNQSSLSTIRALHERLHALGADLDQQEEHFSNALSEASSLAHDEASRLTYAIAFLFVAIGVGLSWPVVLRIRNTERALVESEMRYRGIYESVSDIIYTIEADGRFSAFSPALQRIAGWQPAEWVGRPFVDMVHPNDVSAANEAFRKTMAGEVVSGFAERIQKKSGGYLDLEVNLAPLARNGKVAALLGTARDVTERRNAEAEIRRQHQLTAQIIETIPMRVFWKGRDLRFLGCNTLFAKDAGLIRPEELIGKSDFEMTWKDQAESYRADDQRVMDSNVAKLSYDEPQTTPEGSRIWLRTSKVPLHNQANEVIGVLGLYEDITEYKMAAQALEESERRFRAVLDSAVDGVVVADTQSHALIMVNRAFCAMLGYTESELLQLNIEDIYPDDAMPAVHVAFERMSKSEIPMTPNLPVKRKDGSVFFADISGSVSDLSGRPCMVGVFHDVTERKQAEDNSRRMNEILEEKVQARTQQLLAAQEELVRKEKLALLGQVAGSVGHELRNPLGVMSNAVYFLQTMLPDADKTIGEYLNIIKDEVAISEQIVSDLLDAVRTKPPRTETVSLMTLIDHTLSKCSVPASITVKRDIPAALPPLKVDAMQIHQVFRNLISNGVEAMTNGGALEIAATENKPAGMITVTVRDTGSGIAPEVMEKLFQPLVTTKARGIGLGLVVAKNLIAANGGAISVASTPGAGTVFTVELPAGER